MKYVDQIRISKNLFLIIALTGVLITPLLSFEPILWIKELTLVSITFSTVSIYLLNKENFRKADKLTKYLSIAMLIALLLNLKFSEIDIGTWLWGYFGRANGTLTYTSFLLILFLNSIIDDEAHIKRILRAILIACSFNALYMAFQLADLDPITWNTKETFGFLGNINFSSALTGIFCVILFWQATNTRNVFSFITQCALIMILLYVIWLSGSIQGILMFAIGVQFRCLRILLDTSWFNGRIRLKKITALSQLIVPYFVILTISMPSFFGGRFVQETMLFRKDYWLAAYNMFLNRPFFGVGIDNYGNFYREYRSLSASSDFDRVSNSAHSIFLDLLSGGGATLFSSIFHLGDLHFFTRHQTFFNE